VVGYTPATHCTHFTTPNFEEPVMAKYKVLQFCSTPMGQHDWQIGDVVELPDDTPEKSHLERIVVAPVKKQAASKVAPKPTSKA
jgi:hypothetical protein